MIMDSNELESKVLLALEEIRPFLKSDGGDISLVSIEDDKHCLLYTSPSPRDS